jgi:hypothetical protein
MAFIRSSSACFSNPNFVRSSVRLPLSRIRQHDLLTEQHRQRRDAEVDDPVPHLELEAAVLRHAALGDVELAEDLDAAGERRLELDGRLHHLEQRTVDAVAHPQLVLERLDVDVARAPSHRLGEDAVDELDDRRIVDLRLLCVVVVLVGEDLDVVVGSLHVLQEGPAAAAPRPTLRSASR